MALAFDQKPKPPKLPVIRKKARAAITGEQFKELVDLIRNSEADLIKRSKLIFTASFLFVTGMRIGNIKHVTFATLECFSKGLDFEVELIKTGKRKTIMEFPHNETFRQVYLYCKQEFDYLIFHKTSLMKD